MNKFLFLIILSLIISHYCATGQPSFSFDLKKPPKFENKTLGSEKTGNKKFTVPRRFLQNTFTHYNYYFNANNRLNEIVARAKAANRDDYTELLPFYSYSLQSTATYKTDLDSVIYKSTAGVLIHDLRNDWIDNLYLLIGKAYYLRNDPDSAYLTFQYINYAFFPKEKDGYDKIIGSNQNEGSNAFSISTKENRNVVNKAFSEAPSRNESLVWQIKTYLAKDELAEASGLIQTLKNDPWFPNRLDTDLEEVQALYFYKQQNYDSAAVHMEKALGNAEDNQEQARWEYLIAQLYERAGKHDLAEKFYNKTISHTINPVMEVYARLNAIRQNKNGNEKDIQNAIDALVKMAKKDKYVSYRDIIYYTASLIETERNKPDAAKLLLLKSIKTSTNNPPQKNRSFMALGDLTFTQKLYAEAESAYDSVEIQNVKPDYLPAFTARKDALEKIVKQTSTIDRQDSLQRIAAMPVAERDIFIKKVVKTLRKQQGIKEDDNSIAKNDLAINAAADLFGNNTAKGEWYFSNASLKSRGLADFKGRWGNRVNADNWRRVAATANTPQSMITRGKGFTKASETVVVPMDISFDGLLNNLPLTPEKQKISRDSVENALFEAGKAYMNGLEDYTYAIAAFEKLLTEFPTTSNAEEAWFNLYYCYSKTGDSPNRLKVKQMLASKFPNGKFGKLLNISNISQSPDSIQKSKATVQYEGIYNLFIEGNFKEALKRKKSADSIYGQHFWTPQLLYIQAVYHIHEKEDSTARAMLGSILQLFPSTPIFNKTQTLLEVLSRRREIEDYLTKLDLKKLEEATKVFPDDLPRLQPDIAVVPKDSSNNQQTDAEAAALKAKQELAAVLAAKELKEKQAREDKLAIDLKAKKEQAETNAAKELQAKKDQEEKLAAALKTKKEQAELKAAKELEAKKAQEEIIAAALEAKRKEAELKASKELQEQKEQAEIAARLLKEKKERAEKAAIELQEQKELAQKAAKESGEKKKLEAEIAAKELIMKKEAADIAAKELLAKKEQAAITANEKKASDLAEKERLFEIARNKKALELAAKELAAREAKEKKEKELAAKALAAKEVKDRRDKELAEKDLAAKNKKVKEQAEKEIASKELADKKARDLATKRMADSLTLAKKKELETAKKDTSKIETKPLVTSLVYANKPSDPHYVVLVLDKVDPVYATEARNAFIRYNRESFVDKKLGTNSYSLSDDLKLILVNNFENAGAALNYVEKTEKITQTEIIPWLTAQKYSFLLISASNLEILKNTKDVDAYRKFLKQLFPGKF